MHFKVKLIMLICTFFILQLKLSSQQIPDTLITKEDVQHAEKIIGIPFTGVERDSMLDGFKRAAAQLPGFA